MIFIDNALKVVIAIVVIMVLSSVMIGAESPKDRTIFFEVYHINYAWGFQYEGYYIDSDGYIYNYTAGSDQQIKSPREIQPGKDLNLRSNSSNKLFAKIEISELGKKTAMINSAADGELFPPEDVCNDFGRIDFIAYVYDDTGKTYRPIVLYKAGDSAQKNTSPSANKLARWLNSIIYGSYEIRCGYPE